jgi:UDP-N-acetylglucosamine pyrophosphorylase
MGQRAFGEFAAKMRGAGVGESAIRAFQHNYEGLVAGQTGMIAEAGIQPITELPRLETVSRESSHDPALLSQTVIVKLNGGLGTSMGLERAKSLLRVKNDLTFLDFIAKQVLHMRERYQVRLHFLLMNSFSTSWDTIEFLKRYPELGDPSSLELMQSQAPKVDAGSLRPVSWPENPQLEWCPPGHGDFYPSLVESGWLDRLLKEGAKYLFISNSDNLGANLDLALLDYFAKSAKPFLMEVAERTTADRKGGHLARRGTTLLLRESAQCPEADEAAFQDIERHRFFNTNNLWIRLDALRELLRQRGGFVPLPLIKNSKTVDPREANSPRVVQLETAMGAAIECFANAGAIVVPRNRFTPVKTTADLFALRSDAYQLTEDWRIVLTTANGSQPPALDLDAKHYKLVDQLDEKLSDGVPSLRQCRELVVRGPVWFSSKISFRGKVKVTNASADRRSLAPGEYADTEVTL